MIILPAVVLGGLVVTILVFFIGYAFTFSILNKIAKYDEERHPDGLSEEDIEKTSMVGGAVVFVLVILLLISIGKGWSLAIWIGLTIIGFVASFLSFVLFGSRQDSPFRNKAGPGGRTSVPPRSNETHSHSASKPKVQNDNVHEDFIIVVCEHCSQKLRIPKSNRKLIITCPKCKYSFPYGTNPVSAVEKLKNLLRWKST